MDQDDIWPPPPAARAGTTVKRLGVDDAFGYACGIASLVLTLPGLLLPALGALFSVLSGMLHWKAGNRTVDALTASEYYSTTFMILVCLLPSLGLCAGLLGWRFRWGKLGIATALVHCGLVLAVICWGFSKL